MLLILFALLQKIIVLIHFLHNFVEDRRIDNFIYQNAPGYQEYYNTMYNRYFYSENIDKGLKSSKFRKETDISNLFYFI